MALDRPFKFKLGQLVRDQVTGYEGTVTGRHEYIAGCRQYSVEKLTDGGSEIKSVGVDEERLQLVGSGVELAASPTGGPQSPAPVAGRG